MVFLFVVSRSVVLQVRGAYVVLFSFRHHSLFKHMVCIHWFKTVKSPEVKTETQFKFWFSTCLGTRKLFVRHSSLKPDSFNKSAGCRLEVKIWPSFSSMEQWFKKKKRSERPFGTTTWRSAGHLSHLPLQCVYLLFAISKVSSQTSR